LLFASFFFAVPHLPAEAAVIELSNDITLLHVEVPGTGAHFIPTEGISRSESFDGFASVERAIEFIVVNIKSPFTEISGAFTEANLKMRGIDLKSRTELTINGANAVLMKALHPEGGKNWGKWLLLLENGGGTLVVNGVFVSGDGDAARDVEAMIKSVALEKQEPKPEPPAESGDLAEAGSADAAVSGDADSIEDIEEIDNLDDLLGGILNDK
jgi:hypothetical protein